MVLCITHRSSANSQTSAVRKLSAHQKYLKRRLKELGSLASPTSPLPPDLSAFDESIKALFWSMVFVCDLPRWQRTFSMLLPDRQTKIKNEFTVRHFEDFCVECNKTTASPARLAAKAQTDLVTAHIFDWLTTWCGFIDWSHIHRALRNLRVEIKSLEKEIEQSSLLYWKDTSYPLPMH